MDPFAQLFQHCWGHARSFRVVYKDLWVVSFPRCTAGPNIVGSCCIRLHTPVNTHATTPNIVVPTTFARSLRNELFFTIHHSVFFMIIANITILIFFFMINNIGTVIIIQLTKASTFLTITDVFSIAHLKVFQTPCINNNVSILLL